MYLDRIHSIINFDSSVVRNTPIIDEEDELSDLIDDQFDLGVAKKTMNKANGSAFRKIEYHAIDDIFDQKSNFQSRFTDGTYPIWYGSIDQETTFYETAFHWHRTIIEDIHYDDERPIIINRSLFSVNCNAMLIDLRKATKQIPELTQKELEFYEVTQSIGKKLYEQGQSGLYTYSARKPKGENIAVYNKKILSNPEHIKNVKYTYDFKRSKIQVVDKKTGGFILEI